MMNRKTADTAAVNNIYLPEGQFLSHPRNLEMTASLQGLEKAMNNGWILEGIAHLCDGDMNLHIDFPALPEAEAIIPAKEAVYTKNGFSVKDIAILTRVGKPVCFKVMGITLCEGKPRVLLSRRAAQAECMTNYLTTLIPGDMISARVTHMESFGAFVDIGCGISSLLSVDAISVSRISHPKERFYNGQLIKAVIRSMEWDEDGLPGRIFVSTRELLGTWEENAAKFRAGQTVAGIIRSVEPYGVFVELAPNLAGLAELKEEGITTAEAKALVGRRASVFIKSILPERMKIKLVLIDAFEEDTAPTSPLTYHLPSGGSSHIDHWVYSPAGAKKQIRTIFESK